jgi:hypothetical protein
MTTRSTVRITTGIGDQGGILLQWLRPDGHVEFTFNSMDMHPSLEESVIAYGLKQILSDGGAVSRETPAAERLAKMEKRARGLREGTWNFRDGTAAETPKTDAALMYAAQVAAGMITDTDDTQAVWKSLKPSERRATLDAAGPTAKEYYQQARPAVANGASILGRMRAGGSGRIVGSDDPDEPDYDPANV